MSVLIWVQHLLGTGHLKRALALATAMAARGLRVTIASGGPPVPWLVPAGVELVQLPAVEADPNFALRTPAGAPVEDVIWAARRDRLLALFDALRPRVVITEMFPFGRRAFRAELLPLLEAAAAATPRSWMLASVRDILVRKPTVESYAWMRDLALERYDRVLVHADPRLVRFEQSFPFAAALGAKLVYTGYVGEPLPRPDATTEGRGEVLVSAGGGRVGARLLAAARGARALTRHADVPWRLIGDHGAVEPPPPGVMLDRPRPDFAKLLGNSLLSVSQAGYNTVVETLRLGRRCVLVPFETASENEQRVRAERLAALGLVRVVWESELSAPALASAVDAAIDAPPAPALALDLDGAATSAALVAGLVARGAHP